MKTILIALTLVLSACANVGPGRDVGPYVAVDAAYRRCSDVTLTKRADKTGSQYAVDCEVR